MENDIILEEGSVFGPDYVRRTDAEIKELALMLYRGEIFSSMQIRNQDMSLLPNIFMTILFLDDLQTKMMKENGAFSFYSDMKNAGPRLINGYPMFTSFYYLNEEDTVRFIKKYDEIRTKLNEL